MWGLEIVNKYVATEITNIHRDPAKPAKCTKMNDELNFANFGVNYIFEAQKLWILEFLTMTN